MDLEVLNKSTSRANIYRHRPVVGWLGAAFSGILAILPMVVVLNESLTRAMEKTTLYSLIQTYIVPYEVRVVGASLRLMGLAAQVQSDGLTVNGVFMRVTWNCLGWQSFLFLVVGFLVGFNRKHKMSGVIECIIIGVCGTFIGNILRMVLIVLMGAFAPRIFTLVLHDYLSAVLSIAWFAWFWWFSYNYVLE